MQRENEKYGDDEKIDDTGVIAVRMVSDAAIELFSLAQRCLHAADPEPVPPKNEPASHGSRDDRGDAALV